MSKNSKDLVMKMTTEIVCAYLNSLSSKISIDALGELIEKTHHTLNLLYNSKNEKKSPKPMVPIDKTIFNDYIICLEDGNHYKSLRRHLRVHYNMSPDDYRKKWGLPFDYPMVPPSYAEQRSKLAKKLGLGQRIGQNVRQQINQPIIQNIDNKK